MKKIYYSWSDVEGQTLEIIRQISHDGWRPDYVVGLTRGGLIPANLISQYLEVPMETLKVSLRDDTSGPESNLWMAEDAFGYDSNPGTTIKCNSDLKKKILIVDDINDTGATLNWIKEDWQASCLPNDERWANVWNNNVRFAVLVNNQGSEFKNPDYVGKVIDKRDDDSWIVFPWENWWE